MGQRDQPAAPARIALAATPVIGALVYEDYQLVAEGVGDEATVAEIKPGADGPCERSETFGWDAPGDAVGPTNIPARA